MPQVVVQPDLTMHYEDDCFVAPWQQPDVALLIHGVAESSQAWFAWLPDLTREFRVIRPDLRGFGRSTVPPAGYPWSAQGFATDLARFLDALAVPAAHIVGAKLGGSIALQFAADYPERTRTLTVLSGPVKRQPGSATDRRIPEKIGAKGLRGWVEETQRERLGSQAPAEQIAWWTDFMASADVGVCIGVTTMAGSLDIADALPRIKAPTLVFTSEGSSLQSVTAAREHQETIPNSELLVLPGDSYHVAASAPDACVRAVLDFIGSRSGQPPGPSFGPR